jgi:carbonic anhydrase/acetyltransferase-like protein (isoleucine patch superfamily)
MLIEHRGKRPSIHNSAFVATNAVVCGDVKIGPNAQVAFGAVVVAEGGSVSIGAQSIIRENAVIRATAEHSVQIGDYVLVGPHAALYGCRVEDEAFLATGVTIFSRSAHWEAKMAESPTLVDEPRSGQPQRLGTRKPVYDPRVKLCSDVEAAC